MGEQPSPPAATPRETLPPLPISRRRRDGGWWAVAASALLVVLLALLLAVAFGGRVLHASPWWLTALVVVLPYASAALIGLAFTLWCVWPDRQVLGWLTGAATAGLLGLYGPPWAARPEAADGEQVRVMTWNVRRLWGWGPVSASARPCVAAAIDAAAPDVLTLLEVSAEDVDWLSRELGLRCAHGTYRAGGGVTRGGLATCVRGDRVQLVHGGAQKFVDHEDWFYLFSEVDVNGARFNLLGVHLVPYAFQTTAIGLPRPEGLPALGDATVRAQANQTRALLDRVARLHDPTIIAGDFNSTRDMALHATLRGYLVDTWERGGLGFGATVHAFGFLPVRVDYVYVTPTFSVQGASLGEELCSNHRPVVVDVALRRVLR